MNIILITKDVAEAITAISTAIIILISIVKLLPSPIKNFFTKIIPTFSADLQMLMAKCLSFSKQ